MGCDLDIASNETLWLILDTEISDASLPFVKKTVSISFTILEQPNAKR